ncbi:MAG: aminotransferase class IV [Clostridiales bacterium]|nr:aminotransferase class IV [Clostridiales bacterium]
MAFPIIENPRGEYCICNGEKVLFSSEKGKFLMNPVDQTTYYESIRFRDGIMLFFEDHMLRLYRSVQAKESFEFDSEVLYEQAMRLIRDLCVEEQEGNLRIVLTSDHSVVHLSDATYPERSMFEKGVVTATLKWVRIEPQVKVFRGDYKQAVAERMGKETTYGIPYEVLLCDSDGKITEGSRSNFFVLHEDTVYSPPESMILIGITRKYVMKALEIAGLKYKEQTISLKELVALQDSDSCSPSDVAVFLTSSPFDILPIRSIDDVCFYSAANQRLKRLSEAYMQIVHHYIQSRKQPE